MGRRLVSGLAFARLLQLAWTLSLLSLGLLLQHRRHTMVLSRRLGCRALSLSCSGCLLNIFKHQLVVQSFHLHIVPIWRLLK